MRGDIAVTCESKRLAFQLRSRKKHGMTTDTFKVVIEPDDYRCYAYCPALVERGGSTWGATPEEALANLETVVKMLVASLAEHGEPIVGTAPSGSVESCRPRDCQGGHARRISPQSPVRFASFVPTPRTAVVST
jgi:predicted RNase H-like HicB family nuclease